jgi:hypothetical protein
MKKALKHPLFVAIIVAVISPILQKAPEIFTFQDLGSWIWLHLVIGIWPMWIGLLSGLAYWFAGFLYRLNSFKDWVEQTSDPVLQRWLDINPTYKYRFSESMEGRIVTMLEWWKSR